MNTSRSAAGGLVIVLALTAASAAQRSSGREDDEFIQRAAQAGAAEVALAGVAQRKAAHPRVRELAGRLQREHAVVNRELSALATARRIEIPAASPEQHADRQRLEELGGGAVDRAFVAMMVQSHDAAIARFSMAVKSEDAAVRQLAEKTLPTLRAHQEEVEKVRKAIGVGSDGQRPAPGGAL